MKESLCVLVVVNSLLYIYCTCVHHIIIFDNEQGLVSIFWGRLREEGIAIMQFIHARDASHHILAFQMGKGIIPRS